MLPLYVTTLTAKRKRTELGKELEAAHVFAGATRLYSILFLRVQILMRTSHLMLSPQHGPFAYIIILSSMSQ